MNLYYNTNLSTKEKNGFIYTYKQKREKIENGYAFRMLEELRP